MAGGLLVGCYSSTSTSGADDASVDPPRDLQDTADGPADVAVDDATDPIVGDAEECIDLSGDWVIADCMPGPPPGSPVVIVQSVCGFFGVVSGEMEFTFEGAVYPDSTVWVREFYLGSNWYGSATDSRIDLECSDCPWELMFCSLDRV
jgi:hypothetical protein